MLKTRLITAASAAAIAFAALSAPAFAATTATYAKPPVHQMVKVVHHHYVSGKIVKIYHFRSMIRLSNGKIYHVRAKALATYKVGEHIRLRIS